MLKNIRFSTILSVFAVVLGSLFAVTSAYADAAAETAVTAAITEGSSLIALLPAGLISIAAIMLGVGLVLSWIRK